MIVHFEGRISLRAQHSSVVVEVGLEDGGQHVDLPAVDVELPDEVHLNAEFALALAPFLYPVVEDDPHDAAGGRLHDDQPVLLHPYPRNKLVVVLDEDLALEEVSVEALALRQYLQDLPPRLYLVKVPDFVVIFEDVLLVVGAFCGRGQRPQFPLGDEVLILKLVVLLVLHFRVHLKSGDLDDVGASEGVESPDVLVGTVVVHDGVAPGRDVDVVDVLEDDDRVQSAEELVVLPLVVLLVEDAVVVEIVQQVAPLHQEAVYLQQVLNVGVQVVVLDQLCHEFLHSCVRLHEEHLLLGEAEDDGYFGRVEGAVEFEQRRRVLPLVVEVWIIGGLLLMRWKKQQLSSSLGRFSKSVASSQKQLSSGMYILVEGFTQQQRQHIIRAQICFLEEICLMTWKNTSSLMLSLAAKMSSISWLIQQSALNLVWISPPALSSSSKDSRAISFSRSERQVRLEVIMVALYLSGSLSERLKKPPFFLRLYLQCCVKVKRRTELSASSWQEVIFLTAQSENGQFSGMSCAIFCLTIHASRKVSLLKSWLEVYSIFLARLVLISLLMPCVWQSMILTEEQFCSMGLKSLMLTQFDRALVVQLLSEVELIEEKLLLCSLRRSSRNTFRFIFSNATCLYQKETPYTHSTSSAINE